MSCPVQITDFWTCAVLFTRPWIDPLDRPFDARALYAACLPLLTCRDAVEELEAEASHQKNAEKKDPLEAYCEDVPEADECRTYED